MRSGVAWKMIMANRWRSKVDALIRLARDPGATPDERTAARAALARITASHPEAAAIRDYGPVKQMFTTRDFVDMKRGGISVEGEWTGVNLQDAIAQMSADYARRQGGKRWANAVVITERAGVWWENPIRPWKKAGTLRIVAE